MESATVALTPELSGEPTAFSGDAVYAYLLTINPFVNFGRWALAQFVYWGALFFVGVCLAIAGLV